MRRWRIREQSELQVIVQGCGCGGAGMDVTRTFCVFVRWDHYGIAVARLYFRNAAEYFEMRLKIYVPNAVSIYKFIYDFCLSLISAYHPSFIHDL